MFCTEISFSSAGSVLNLHNFYLPFVIRAGRAQLTVIKGDSFLHQRMHTSFEVHPALYCIGAGSYFFVADQLSFPCTCSWRDA